MQGKLQRFIGARPDVFALDTQDNQFVRLAAAQPASSHADPIPLPQRSTEERMPARRVVSVRPLPPGNIPVMLKTLHKVVLQKAWCMPGSLGRCAKISVLRIM